jgi:hypothetical protein
MQSDGNLVAYDSKNVSIWATHTGARSDGPFAAYMQDDGNFCVYNTAGASIWNSGTQGK